MHAWPGFWLQIDLRYFHRPFFGAAEFRSARI